MKADHPLAAEIGSLPKDKLFDRCAPLAGTGAAAKYAKLSEEIMNASFADDTVGLRCSGMAFMRFYTAGR